MKVRLTLTAIIGCFLFSVPAEAGPYTDKMAVCLVDNTTKAEQYTLIRWTVWSYGHHPKVADLVELDQSREEKTQRDMANLFSTLMTERCASETREAFRQEGQSAIEGAFNVLGQVAARELISAPAVNKSMTKFEKYLDEKKLKEVFN